MSALAYALQLAARGLPCFPCGFNKRPTCPGGFKAATTDEAALRALWQAFGGVLVGVPTGATSGLDVLDIDPRNGGDAWETANSERLPVTRVHATRSGGRHYLFRHAEGVHNSASKIAPGVDVRGTGGLVIWWPAASCDVSNRATVADWPVWLLSLLLPKPTPPAPPPPPRSSAPASGKVERMLRSAFLRVETARPGERHDQLRASACTIGGLLEQAGISEAAATRALLDAVKRAGGDAVNDENAAATIAWGLTKGAASPLSLGGQDGR